MRGLIGHQKFVTVHLYILRCTVGNCLKSLIMSCHISLDGVRLITLLFEAKLQKCIRIGVTIFKIFIWEGISLDISSEITF